MTSSTTFTAASATAGDWIQIAGILDLQSTSHTLATWLRWGGLGLSGSLNAVIGTGNTTVHLPLYILNSSSKLQAYYESGVRCVDTETVSTDTWYFAAVTFDGGAGSGQARLYRGGPNSEATLKNTSTNFNINTTNSSQITIGRYSTGGNAQPYNGQLAHTHIYSRVLSLNELIEIQYNPGTIKTNLLGYYPMLNASPETDFSGLSNNGSVNGTPAASALGPPTKVGAGGV